MARKPVDLEGALTPLGESETIKEMQAASEQAADKQVEIYPCVCGNSYPYDEFKMCPRCERPKIAKNRAGEPQDGSQNL